MIYLSAGSRYAISHKLRDILARAVGERQKLGVNDIFTPLTINIFNTVAKDGNSVSMFKMDEGKFVISLQIFLNKVNHLS